MSNASSAVTYTSVNIDSEPWRYYRKEPAETLCMRTRSSSNLPVESPPNPSNSNPKRRNHIRSKQPFILEESPVDTMANQRTMVKLLRAPTEGYAKAIMVPLILAEQFELKHNLINMMTSDQFFELEKDNPHDHIRWDNIQGYVATAAVNYNQVVPLSELEKVKRMNEANIKAMQTQINNVKNELRNEMKNSIQASMSNQTNELKNMMASFFQMNTASTLRSGSLLSNTIPNLKGKLKAITTQSGIVLDGPSVPTPPLFINSEEDKHVEETLTNQDLVEYTIKVPPPLKMVKALFSNKEKLLKLANTPLNENCSAIILKKLPEKLGDPVKFLIPCGFSELKCKALADLANRAICTPAGIAKDVFVPVDKFTFPANFVIVDYESDPRVPLILGRPFLQTAHALIDVHKEEMILHDGDERLTLNTRHDTSSYSNQPQKESINLINVFNDSNGGNVLPEKLLDLDSIKDLHPPHHVNPLSGSTTTSSSPNQLLEEFADELALITFPPRYEDLSFNIESNLKEIEYLLYHDPIKDIDSILKDSIDQSNLADLNDNLVNSMLEMFTNKHALDYSSPLLYDEYDDDLFEVESNTENVYDDPFDSKRQKIK
nr:hypothetical protein [Tanacetum cinerariifolium]